MIQEQLVDYISSQMKSGVSQDVIKATLTGAGWASLDVDDTFKKINSTGASVAQPTSGSSPLGTAVSPATAKSAESQTIRVSDLVSASYSAAAAAVTSSPKSKIAPLEKTNVNAMKPVAQMVAKTAMKPGGGFVMTIIWISLIILFAALAGFFFFQNMNLSSQLAAQSKAPQSPDLSGQVATLQGQVQSLTGANASATAQLGALQVSNQNLKTELSFYVIPAGTTPTTTSLTISGVFSGGKPTFILTTADGIKLFVKNSADMNVKNILQPLASSSATAQIQGTYIPGTSIVILNMINGAPVIAPALPQAMTSTGMTASTSSTPSAGVQ